MKKKKYYVCGTIPVVVTKEVWAENEHKAIERANENGDCVESYAGNGGLDKLIGVYGSDLSIQVDGIVEFDDAQEA